MEYVVEMLNIRKEFPGIVANDNITLQIKPQEVHALLGENGAGKSTIMSILFGIYHADAGEIRVKGKKVTISDPNDANDLGIGMVHQHFKLVENFTVTENIILGMEGGQILNRKAAAEEIRKLSEKFSLKIDPNAKIESISVGMQQRVEILKMLYRKAEILIFDEPTGVLTPQETHELMHIMHELIKEGKSIILITHKLREIKEIADRCSIIRRGKLVGVVDVKKTSEKEMASMMVGREVSFKVTKKAAKPGDLVLDVQNVSVQDERKYRILKNFSVQVRAGEIVGIAGVDGNGQRELVGAITGLTQVESGKILLKGEDISRYSIRRRNEAGVAHIPEDRHKHGLVLDFTLAGNMVLKSYYQEPYSRRGVLNDEVIQEHADKVIKLFDVRSGRGGLSLAKQLSGGNQQKAIVGREIDMNPELLIAVQPTRGLDVGAIEYIHKRLVEQRDNGRAVLLVSLELDEIFNLADRIAVISNGELIDVVETNKTNEEEIGLMMAGYKRGETHEANA